MQITHPSASNFFALPQKEQREIFIAAAYKLRMNPAIVEKDLWVSWALEQLFSMQLPTTIIFKGGTSLSKVYNLIQRFSEDIDITLDYRGFVKLDLPLEKYTKSFLKKLGEELKQFVCDCVYQTILPNFEQVAVNLGFADTIKFEISENGEKLRIYYPSVLTAPSTYIADSILIEFGGRNSVDPSEIYVIRPYLANFVSNLILPAASVNVLSPLRTFWEKATLIHVECHRRRIGEQPDRLSRHWYDLAMLFESAIGSKY